MSEQATGREGEMRCCGTCRAIYRNGFERCPIDGTELAPFESDPLVGTTIHGLYEIEACVGEGAMGRVYRAHHLRLHRRRVALKILLGDLAATVTMRLRFTQEAQAASLLSHPNVVPVLDFGKDEHGLLYLAMEYVEGRSLAQIIADEGPLDPARVIRISRQLCMGLAHAHSQGLIHRDFKPDNVLVVEEPGGETPRIADFGLAIFTDSDQNAARLTGAGIMVGTPLYTAPEQALDRGVDQRADLFGLGVTMYEMLAGIPPFDDSAGAVEILHRNLSARRPWIAERAPGVAVPPALEQVVHRLMSPDRENRYASAPAVADALEWLEPSGRHPRPGSVTDPGAPSLRESTVPDHTVEPGRGRGRLIAMGAALVGGLAIAALALWWPIGPEPMAQESEDADPPAARPTAARAAPPRAAPAAALPTVSPLPPDPDVEPSDEPTAHPPVAGAAPAYRPLRRRLRIPRGGPNEAFAAMPAGADEDPDAALAAPAASADPAPGDGGLASTTAATSSDEGLASAGLAAVEERSSDGRAPSGTMPGSGSVPGAGAASPGPASPGAGPASSGSPGAPAATTRASASGSIRAGVIPAEGGLAGSPSAPAPSKTQPSRASSRIAAAEPARRPALRARAAFEALEVEGSLSAAEVRRGVERVTTRLATCYRAAAIRAGRDGGGAVRVSFVVGESGRVTQVRAGDAPLPGLATCVVEAIGSVRTRIAPDVGDVRVTLRVNFSPFEAP